MTAINVLTDADRMTAIKKAVGNGKETMRRVYSDTHDAEGKVTHTAIEQAKAAFQKAQELAVADGVEAYALPDDTFTLDTLPAVAVVGSRARGSDGKMVPGIRAVVMFPMPTADAFITHDEKSADWVRKIIEKESAHVAFRELRNAESIETLRAKFETMPRDVDTYIAEHARGGDGLDTEAFDTMWGEIRKALKSEMPALVDLLPQKGEVLKAIRSKKYAESEKALAPLEARGVFVYLANMLIKAGTMWRNSTGELDPMDTSTISEWLAERDELEIKRAEPTEKDFSVLESLDLGIA